MGIHEGSSWISLLFLASLSISLTSLLRVGFSTGPLCSMGNAQEMVRQAKLSAEGTSSLINAIKREVAAETDPDARKKLLDTAKALANSTASMVGAAKMAACNPHDEHAQENMRKAVEHLRAVANTAASNALRKKAIGKLEVAAKQAQCIAAARGSAASNRNEASQSQLINHCKAVAEQISALVTAVTTSMSNQDSTSAQLGLINASQAMIPVTRMIVVSNEFHYIPLIYIICTCTCTCIIYTNIAHD